MLVVEELRVHNVIISNVLIANITELHEQKGQSIFVHGRINPLTNFSGVHHSAPAMPSKSIFRQPGAKNFQLVHRSQRDPLINDPEASERVLKEFERKNAKVCCVF